MKVHKIDYPSSPEESDPENDNLDVHLTLEDGRTYSFVVATPKNIYWCMENEAKDYFFGIPPVFVKQLTRQNIETALRALVSKDKGKWLDVYGVLQTTTAHE